jgi:murein DD-endopeptidase MepM/ murein hydrolase activator NlpD
MIEIQLHPSDIRRRVRYFFVSRRSFACAIGAGFVLLAFLLSSMAAAPSVIKDLYKDTSVRMMRQTHAVESQRLREHIAQITTLERMLDEHRVHVEKLMAVYGLDRNGLGHGGISNPFSKPSSAAIELADAERREVQLRRSIQLLDQQLDMLAEYEKANRDLVRHIPSILPLPTDQFVLTSSFGTRISPFTKRADFHKGLDLAAPADTPIYAAADGVVTFAGRVSLGQSVNWWRFGNVVVINHANRFITIYGHCDSTSVHSGQNVHQGDMIAKVGSTGWSTNSHLHYEVRCDLEQTGVYKAVDPRIYILNYQWNNEPDAVSRARESKDLQDFDPLPSAFIGRRRV